MNRAPAAALLLFIGIAPLAAQTKSGVFLGRVTDSLGTPVPHVAIALLGTSLQMLADSNGRFRFPVVPVGSHTVVARAIGWKPQLFMIRMEEGQEQTFQIGLERAPQSLPDLIAKGTVLEKPPEYAFTSRYAVWIDGSRVMTDDHNYALDYVSPADIEMIEVYRRGGQIPAEFLSDACAAIVIWTR